MSAVVEAKSPALVTYDTHPDRYVHWRLSVDGPAATLAMDVNEERGLKPGYKLKLNSYDLGVDIELHDAHHRQAQSAARPCGRFLHDRGGRARRPVEAMEARGPCR